MFKIGKVVRYYEKIGVAVVELIGSIAEGDKIRFVKEGKLIFEQIVETIQIGYRKVKFADRGSIIGLKTDSPVSVGVELFRYGQD